MKVASSYAITLVRDLVVSVTELVCPEKSNVEERIDESKAGAGKIGLCPPPSLRRVLMLGLHRGNSDRSRSGQAV